MGLINATAQLPLGPLAGTLSYLEALIGGLFGLYLILVILRWYESRRLVHILKDIRHDIRHMGEQQGFTVKQRQTIVRLLGKTKFNSRIKKKIKKTKLHKKIKNKLK